MRHRAPTRSERRPRMPSNRPELTHKLSIDLQPHTCHARRGVPASPISGIHRYGGAPEKSPDRLHVGRCADRPRRCRLAYLLRATAVRAARLLIAASNQEVRATRCRSTPLPAAMNARSSEIRAVRPRGRNLRLAVGDIQPDAMRDHGWAAFRRRRSSIRSARARPARGVGPAESARGGLRVRCTR